MQEDLLNMEPKKDLKKPLIYGAIGFLVFIIVVIGVAIYQNSKNKDNNVNEIIPPEATTQKEVEFKPIEVEEPKIDTKKLAESEKEVKTKPEPKPKPKPQPKKEPKQVEKKEVKPEPVKETKPKKVERNYYIQVAALLKNAKPNPKFLSIIEKNGFNYTLYKTSFVKNGEKIKVTKVLIGPFKTKEEAQKALKKVKNSITQNAFIFRVKK